MGVGSIGWLYSSNSAAVGFYRDFRMEEVE